MFYWRRVERRMKSIQRVKGDFNALARGEQIAASGVRTFMKREELRKQKKETLERESLIAFYILTF